MPEGMSEAEVVAVMEEVVNLLAHRFVFGYYSKEDIKQEGYRIAWQILPKYDGKRPLANFLFVSVRNRLCNLRRDKFRRSSRDVPCLICHEGRENEHADGEVCRAYREWWHRNQDKSNLAQPQPMGALSLEEEARKQRPLEERLEREELREQIDRILPLEYRADYLRMQSGLRVAKQRREEIVEVIRTLLWGSYAEEEGDAV